MSELEHANGHLIEVVKQPVARLLINYYWVPVLLSFCLFLYEPGGSSEILLSYYLLYLVVGGLTKCFVQKRIARTFYEFRNAGSLDEHAFQTLSTRFETRLNNSLANIFGIVSGLWVLLWFYGDDLPNLISYPLDSLRSIAIVAIDVLLGYAIGSKYNLCPA